MTDGVSEVHRVQPDHLHLCHGPSLMAAYARNLRATGREVPEPGPSPVGTDGFTDMGDLTHALPAINPAIGVLGAQGMPRSRQFAEEVSGSAGDEAVLDGALTMARTGLGLAIAPQ
ncbi:hypothetical protein [Streptomyces sp. NBC_01445]|uniref:hypothetical protein n=1 Tax=Streptomyces sp. NBC_01445 TaxID=2903869 RepID=UPI002DDA4F6B|nr:hypothetical protein [Streptomyces sp. NBC_01445]WSE09481.1 hypothetical protein OG574_42605 [Streptomyces sp. NBC_01445]